VAVCYPDHGQEHGQRQPHACERWYARLSDSNRTILAAKELRHITQILVRPLINPRFDAILYETYHSRLNDGPKTSYGCPNNHVLINSLGVKSGGIKHPPSISQIA